MKKIKPVKIRVSENFLKMLDIERNLQDKRMSRVLFTEKKADELREEIYERFGKKKRGFIDDFKI